MARTSYKNPEDDGYSILPRGAYDVKITDVQETVSKTKQKPQFEVTGEIVGGQYDERTVMMWYSRVPKAAWKIHALVTASEIDVETDELDEKDDKGRVLNEYSFDYEDLIGRVICYDVEEDSYNGKPKNNFVNERPAKKSAEKEKPKEEEKKDGDKPEEKAEEKPETEEKPTGRRRRRSA